MMATKDKKGLGTGLGALFGDAAGALPNDFEYLSITKIEPRRDQPRTIFAQEPLEELAASIREHGIVSPLTVRPMADGFYQIIAGERRWRAARLAGLSEVPARILSVDDRAAMELSLIENLQREDLNPIEEALGYQSLQRDFDLTQEEIAARMGKSRPVVANALRLLTLPQELMELVQAGELSTGSARALATIGYKEDMIAAAKKVVAEGLSTRQAEQLAKQLGGKLKKSGEPLRTPKVDYAAEFEKSLSETLGRRVKITGASRKKGRIEMEYYGEEDFERLTQWLFAYKENES
ncbi:MAG: ParB/RepB/Spo0J family partition protein [Oscillospiraceae bacterium]|jgi:ParB family chromosome partitioning protein|nr:ParB/RepB/Spo0J family partition protein [Oscillospiraceae bacterium]